jgi:hypothetical protein
MDLEKRTAIHDEVTTAIEEVLRRHGLIDETTSRQEMVNRLFGGEVHLVLERVIDRALRGDRDTRLGPLAQQLVINLRSAADEVENGKAIRVNEHPGLVLLLFAADRPTLPFVLPDGDSLDDIIRGPGQEMAGLINIGLNRIEAALGDLPKKYAQVLGEYLARREALTSSR